MRLEAEGKLGDAQAVYNSILQEDETNMVHVVLRAAFFFCLTGFHS